MKILIPIIITILGCNSYKSYIAPDSKKNHLISNKRIALIGFMNYEFQMTKDRQGDLYKSSASLNYNQSMKQLFPAGKDVSFFNSKEINGQIGRDNCLDLVYEYINIVKDSGKMELSNFIDFDLTPDTSKSKCQVKTNNVDYYILGIPGKPFNSWVEYDASFFGYIQSAASVLSFFIIPSKKAEPVNAYFYVYDSKLNLIDKFEYKKQVVITTSWWFNLNINEKEFVFKDIDQSIIKSQENITKEFSYDFNAKYK
ncbi:hypothetical protein EHQ31_13540 [Leptospira montravelensis]|uniref:Lipoprotein n=1 Tax=Leptospira montravelensis TaxID=2484961 RepID=A0ABY2LTG0_9LEPT|nr:hypothetical protein [Leptospira montravelensis]TGK80626.1 hypothetical protein EHQ19_13285 [Leptospira montravelensis]TGL01785.1 hypothetical protein EHQ31_13540 [Leptospira montravelensis]